jgi:hypothetical protein
MTRQSGPGRHDLRRVPEPTGGYSTPPRSVNNSARDVVPIAVTDAYEPQRRVRALARIDLLDRERRTGRIDEASFQMGRDVELVFENMSRVSGIGQWFEGDRIDGKASAELKNIVGLERAREVNSFLTWLLRHVGPLDTRLLWIILGNRASFSVAALALFGACDIRKQRYTSDRFRDALATLSFARSAKGRGLK